MSAEQVSQTENQQTYSNNQYVQAMVKYENEPSKKPCHNYTE